MFSTINSLESVMITIFESSVKLSESKVFELPMRNVNTGWDGTILPWNFSFAIAIDPEILWLVGGSSELQQDTPPCEPTAYFDGLWNYNVIEFFFAGSNTNYIEFHLAPEGRWWCHRFIAPLVRDEKYSPPNTTRYTQSTMGWKTILAAPMSHIINLFSGRPTHANVTAKFNSQKSPYASYARLPGDRPSFHQPTHFPKIRYVQL